jgi:hypothetical protein
MDQKHKLVLKAQLPPQDANLVLTFDAVEMFMCFLDQLTKSSD